MYHLLYYCMSSLDKAINRRTTFSSGSCAHRLLRGLRTVRICILPFKPPLDFLVEDLYHNCFGDALVICLECASKERAKLILDCLRVEQQYTRLYM